MRVARNLKEGKNIANVCLPCIEYRFYECCYGSLAVQAGDLQSTYKI